MDRPGPEAHAELTAAEEAQASLSKRINKKVIAMFDKAEAEFKALQEKRRIVLNDRHKIEAVISELDEKKREALEVTWNKVNADFGRESRPVALFTHSSVPLNACLFDHSVPGP